MNWEQGIRRGENNGFGEQVEKGNGERELVLISAETAGRGVRGRHNTRLLVKAQDSVNFSDGVGSGAYVVISVLIRGNRHYILVRLTRE